MTQRILNAEPTPIGEIRNEQPAPLDRLASVTPGRVLLPNIPPVTDQGSEGTCVAHAAGGVYSWWYRQRYGKFPAIDQRAFYDLCKKIDGQPDPERMLGTYLLTALRVMRGSGYPLVGGGRGPKITGYLYVGSVFDDLQRAIDQMRSPVLFRLDWDANWMYLPASRIVKAPVGQYIGGHALYSIGFDDSVNGESAIDRNSWGAWSSGGNGTCYFADRYKDTHGLEGWIVTGIG